MVCVGIDVAKDKHDCFILSSEGKVLAEVFTIANSMEGFQLLLEKIYSCTLPQDSIKVGLEATGHYSYNLLGFLLDSGLPTYVLNPLHTNLYRKSLSLRKTKTDKVDARTIAAMLLSDLGLKPYTDTAYHNEELKSLTRYRFDKVRERAKLKQSVSRLVCTLFPELENLVPSLHMSSVYALLEEFPGAKQIADSNLTRLKFLLAGASKGRYGRDIAVAIRDAARASIGSIMPAKSLELRHTIRLIRELDAEIADIESSIRSVMEELRSPITTIPGMGLRMGAMILAEVGDFSRFDSPDKVLAYAGLSPSIYQSGQLNNGYAHMEKRGSRYLRFAIYNAAKYVCIWDPTFAAYLAKKRAEGKHYNVALSHAAKKLVRLICAMEKSRLPYRPVTAT
ncbi:IS110 family transposase [Oscillospiraceae bacterium 38-13]